MQQHGVPTKITVDGYQGNQAAIRSLNEKRTEVKLKPIEIRRCAYLNNVVEPDHRAIKHKVNPMLGFKSFAGARATLDGLELVPMLRKGQNRPKWSALSLREQFERLAA